MREKVMYVIFQDLYKSYYALDRDRCLKIMGGYSVGHQSHRILQT